MIEYDSGFHLLGTDLWFDSAKKVPLSFISSADSEKFTPSGKIIATPETLALLGKKVSRSSILACPYGRPFSLGNMRIELIPAGHILGAAQMLIDKSGTKILYANEINLSSSPTAAPAEVRTSDVLVMRCGQDTRGREFAPVNKVMDEIRDFIDGCLSAGAVPVVLCDTPGNSQNIIKSLGDRGYFFSCHNSIKKTAGVYAGLGVQLKNYESLKSGNLNGKTVLLPLRENNAEIIAGIGRKKIALVCEQAREGKDSETASYNADRVFALGRGAVRDELEKFVKKVNPGTLYLAGAGSFGLARRLEGTGIEVISLEKPEQMRLI